MSYRTTPTASAAGAQVSAGAAAVGEAAETDDGAVGAVVSYVTVRLGLGLLTLPATSTARTA